jgi:NAD(P)H-nitrite reductase large subunit
VGLGHCDSALIDTEALTRKILARFAGRSHIKGKLKMAIAACPMCCSGIKNCDIGIMAIRNGFEVFVGGKGGAKPLVGRRIARRATEAEVMEILTVLIEFHDRKTDHKQRLHRLLDDPEFPLPEV